MKKFRLNNEVRNVLEKWMHQNDAEMVESEEGCLLDNYLMYCKRGIAVIVEKYVNCWTSCHEVHFYRPDESLDAHDEWQELVDAYRNGEEAYA